LELSDVFGGLVGDSLKIVIDAEKKRSPYELSDVEDSAGMLPIVSEDVPHNISCPSRPAVVHEQSTVPCETQYDTNGQEKRQQTEELQTYVIIGNKVQTTEQAAHHHESFLHSGNSSAPSHDSLVDLPLALRKGKTTAHPISHFISYDSLSPS